MQDDSLWMQPWFPALFALVFKPKHDKNGGNTIQHDEEMPRDTDGHFIVYNIFCCQSI